MKARMKHTGTMQARGASTETEGRGLDILDRLIGDALVGAMILLGFALCLGAARAEAPNYVLDEAAGIQLDRR